MSPRARSRITSLGRQLWRAARPCGLSLSTVGNTTIVHTVRYVRFNLLLVLNSLFGLLEKPSWDVDPLAYS